MISAASYYTVYLIIVTIITCFVSYNYSGKNGLVEYSSKSKSSWGTFLLASFMVMFIGFRPVSSVFVDMMNYISFYHAFHEGSVFIFDKEAENLLFDNYFAWIGSMRLGTTFFFVTIAAIYFICTYIACKRMFPRDTLIAYLVFLAAFSTFSYGTNGVKAGAAAAIFLMAMSFRDNLKICIPLVLVSWGFHHSMIMVVVAFVLTLIYKNTKVYFAGWCFCLLIAAAHISFFQELFAGILSDTGDQHGAEYLTDNSDWGGKTGFRIDFVFYSAMPILVWYWAVYKKKLQLSKMYTCLLNLYMTLNGTWMLCIYASFTNRIAYLSWFLYPIVLIYPFLNENWGASRYKTLSKVVLAHLGFTLFMHFVYY
ncbi:MAG: EpsG family protein [Bacteroidales bacterium]|nr:EpsG family protein [Bacteroidales bacterium]